MTTFCTCEGGLYLKAKCWGGACFETDMPIWKQSSDVSWKSYMSSWKGPQALASISIFFQVEDVDVG